MSKQSTPHPATEGMARQQEEPRGMLITPASGASGWITQCWSRWEDKSGSSSNSSSRRSHQGKESAVKRWPLDEFPVVV